MTNPAQKLNLEQSGTLILRMYFFLVQPDSVQINLYQDLQSILAYTPEEAIETLRTLYPAGRPLTITTKGDLKIKDLIASLNMANPPTQPAALNNEEFAFSLMIMADKFVEDPKDLAALRRIIKKITSKKDDPKP